MTNTRDAYEQLFYAARADVENFEKEAVFSTVVRGAQMLGRKATGALDSMGVNKLPRAAGLNESATGKRIAEIGDRLVADPAHAARQRAAATSSVSKNLDEAQVLENKAHAARASGVRSRDAEVQKKFDEFEKERSMLPAIWNPPTPKPGAQAGSATSSAAGQQAKQQGRSGIRPLHVGVGVAGAGAAGVAGNAYGRRKAEEEWRKNRNLAFGAGVATGAAAPSVYRTIDRGVQAIRDYNR